MKIVIDTNVLIDGFKDEYSYEKRIINEVISGHLEAYANHQTLDENRLLLGRLVSSADYERELANFFSQVNAVINRHKISIVRDSEDNKILESAVEARADYLITSDNDLLHLGSHAKVQIVNPSEFWAKYSEDDKDNLWTRWTDFITKG